MSNKNNDDLKRQASENTLGLNPIIALRKKDLLASARMVLTQAIKQPLHSVKHVAHFGVELKNVVFGKSQLTPEADDRRFNDPAWTQNPLYKRYLQTYLAWRKELHDWIGDSNLSEHDISRGHFVINLMTEAMAPTNSAANPAAVKRFFETGGKSLLDGLSHLAKDMVHNGGMPSQVNMGAFEVGKSLGTTEGAVVFRNDVLELIQYRPITEQVYERPLLVVPPQINKFYVFDLSPDKSLARFCLRNNQQTFIVSWRNPTKAQREWGLSTYIEALKEAVDVVSAITGSKDINMIELNSETDFVAKSDNFIALAERVLAAVVASGASETEAALAAEADGQTLAELISTTAATLGEKIVLRRVASLTAPKVTSYLHRTSTDLPPSIGVLVGTDEAGAVVGKDIAQHIAAMTPTYLSREDVPAEIVASERRIAEETSRNEGKPEAALPKIIEGRLGGFFKDVVLLEQPLAKDPKKTVAKTLEEVGGTATSFVRFRVGA